MEDGTVNILNRIRNLVNLYTEKQNFSIALFWADKADTISKGSYKDALTYVICLINTKQYHRAANIMENRRLSKLNLTCKYITALCYFEARDYPASLDLLESNNDESRDIDKNNEFLQTIDSYQNILTYFETNIESSVYLLKARIFEALNNVTLATECYREALKLDPFCYEAFESLVNHQMLSYAEEQELLDSIPWSNLPEYESKFLKDLYIVLLKKYSKPQHIEIPETLKILEGNLDLESVKVETCLYNCDYHEALKFSQNILQHDPYHITCLSLYLICLVELRHTNTLFQLAHQLVDIYPSKALSWFAVGCYYFITGRYDQARHFFSKATILEPTFSPVWLAYGHAFAVENEHDQAIAAYFKASKLMKGCHLPLLYVGLEYGITNNPKLAQRFFQQALTLAPDDSFVLHEMGVVAFQSKEYHQAEQLFRIALAKLIQVDHIDIPPTWESLLNNLGHTCRKLGYYNEAIQFHQQALILHPRNASTYTALGFTNALNGQFTTAISYLHQALGLKRQDSFATSLLNTVTEFFMSNSDDVNDVLNISGSDSMDFNINT